MNYIESYLYFKKNFSFDIPELKLPRREKMVVSNIPFESKNYKILPGEKEYKYNNDLVFNDVYDFDYDEFLPASSNILNIADSKVQENKKFSYVVVRPILKKKAKEVIILLHGLNEKNWDKYLPWAYFLANKTKKPVILFPLAFNMNRVPPEWTDARKMYAVSSERKKIFKYLTNSSFANAAMSTRFQEIPQRMFWSGLQSFYDIVQLTDDIKNGENEFIEPTANIDFFGYSIGGSIALTLLMSNPKEYYTNSKVFAFCGGSVFNRTDPNTRFILDSEACIAVNTFYFENLDSVLQKDLRLAYYLNENHPIGSCFKSMLIHNKMKVFREDLITKLGKQIFAIGLEKDVVVLPFDIMNTLKGDRRNMPPQVKVIDLPYPYTHENPFPINFKYRSKINRNFRRIFKTISDALD